MQQLILASQSPSRKFILDQAGFVFEVDVSGYEEDMTLSMTPAELAKHLSLGKAEAVAARRQNGVVLAADSFGHLNGQLFGKPHTTEKAKEMLRTLSGQTHTFVTGFTVIDLASDQKHNEAVETRITFKKLSPEEIDFYLAEEDVLEKAGAYSILGKGRGLVAHVEGSVANAGGLPIERVTEVLAEFGVQPQT
ncbi:MAG TPA: nucleoside triphosphate pyrophosphatase [Candidatus Saccharimonadales bacterium]|nr:nucleoside triphosphate pyrophosphatase [Candidatus Saccharimonadales bacterium]